jgi:L-lactate dehydrogenase (cytochrome)
LSTSASHSLDQIVEQAPEYPFFFQLYVNKDRKKSAQVLSLANSLGMKAIFVTVDAAARGKRESDERLQADTNVINPVTGERAKHDKKGGGLTRLMGSYIDQSLNWNDLEWIRRCTDLPIVLKGVTCAEDAKLAMRHGVDGILLSNHGGRNLDFTPPSILLLLEMHKNCPEVFDKMEVYVDGGIRRGGDILKALCLGAKAVGMGRTFLYALNYGTEGAEHLVDSEFGLVKDIIEEKLTWQTVLRDELESAMRLIGVKNLSEVHPGLVNTFDVDYLVPSTPDHPYAKWRPRPIGSHRF